MELLTPGIGLVFWTLIVVITLLILLRKYAWKTILQSIDEREAAIVAAIATAENLKAEMALMKKENELLLSKARDEREIMLKEAKLHCFKIIHEAKEKANLEYSKQVSEAFTAIRQQKNVALEEAKKQVDAIAIEVSEKILRRRLKSNNQVR